MKDSAKVQPPKTLAADIASAVTAPRRRARLLLYAFAAAFAAATAYLAFSSSLPGPAAAGSIPAGSPPPPGLAGLFAPYRSQISAFLSSFLPPPNNGSSGVISAEGGGGFSGGREENVKDGTNFSASRKNETSVTSSRADQDGFLAGGEERAANATAPEVKNATRGTPASGSGVFLGRKGGGGSANSATGAAVIRGSSDGQNLAAGVKNGTANVVPPTAINQTQNAPTVAIQGGAGGNNGSKVDFSVGGNEGGDGLEKVKQNAKTAPTAAGAPSSKTSDTASVSVGTAASNGKKESPPVSASSGDGTREMPNSTTSAVETKDSGEQEGVSAGEENKNGDEWMKEMVGCDMFHGKWVKDDSYPLYPEGSCPHIDEPFDCYLNGRPDRAYQKLRWQPNGCKIPRLNATHFLEHLRGKRLAFIGDSLNRNMWESLVCALRHSIKDKTRVFEASGQREFRTEGSYSFKFTDYNCSIEFFRSPFLVQESETTLSNGKTKETLRLDIIERSSPKYKNSDVIVFNTGHWWTHEKTSLGRDYYQEGDHIYNELNVMDAFRKALMTWAKWVDANVDPKRTTVFFRGYSASHFSGGQWNSGGACDKETEPIQKEEYLNPYPPKMRVLEEVIRGMKTPVVYLNITRMTDYRKDAHPSAYRKQNLTEEERRSPERFQDCSHWCLPGVPDSWNEILYAQILVRQYQVLHRR